MHGPYYIGLRTIYYGLHDSLGQGYEALQGDARLNKSTFGVTYYMETSSRKGKIKLIDLSDYVIRESE